jgi:transcriptional regulator with XRE-family HTH domain
MEQIVTAIVRRELAALKAPVTARAIRIRKGVEIKDLAIKSGISATTIAKLERGGIEIPRIQTLNKLADALGVGREEYRGAAITK